jgi:hypothetical protein
VDAPYLRAAADAGADRYFNLATEGTRLADLFANAPTSVQRISFRLRDGWCYGAPPPGRPRCRSANRAA